MGNLTPGTYIREVMVSVQINVVLTASGGFKGEPERVHRRIFIPRGGKEEVVYNKTQALAIA